jgi:hypothetical protein
VLPTYEDAFHHGFIVGGIGVPLIFYVVGIYVFASEVDSNVSAKRNGLFASCRRGGGGGGGEGKKKVKGGE